MQWFSFSLFSCIGGHSFLSKDFFHTEADAGTITAALTRGFLRVFHQVIAVLFAKYTSGLPVFPEIALPAAGRAVLVITDAVDQDCFVVIHGILHSVDVIRSGEPETAKSARDGSIYSSLALCNRIWSCLTMADGDAI